jgi:hypothetical protein
MEKFLKHKRQGFFGNPLAVVSHRRQNAAGTQGCHRNRHPPSRRRKLQRVQQQVVDHFRYGVFLDPYPRSLCIVGKNKGNLFFLEQRGQGGRPISDNIV